MSLPARTRTGLVIAALLGVTDVVAAFFQTPEGELGPPTSILLLGALFGLVTLVAAGVAWRTGRRGALRIVAVTRVLSAVGALPAFFVDVAAWMKLGAAVGVVLTVVCVVLVLSPARRSAAILD